MTLYYYQEPESYSHTKICKTIHLYTKPTWRSAFGCLSELKRSGEEINPHSTYYASTEQTRSASSERDLGVDNWVALLDDYDPGTQRYNSGYMSYPQHTWEFTEVRVEQYYLKSIEALVGEQSSKLDNQSGKLDKLSQSLESLTTEMKTNNLMMQQLLKVLAETHSTPE